MDTFIHRRGTMTSVMSRCEVATKYSENDSGAAFLSSVSQKNGRDLDSAKRQEEFDDHGRSLQHQVPGRAKKQKAYLQAIRSIISVFKKNPDEVADGSWSSRNDTALKSTLDKPPRMRPKRWRKSEISRSKGGQCAGITVHLACRGPTDTV